MVKTTDRGDTVKCKSPEANNSNLFDQIYFKENLLFLLQCVVFAIKYRLVRVQALLDCLYPRIRTVPTYPDSSHVSGQSTSAYESFFIPFSTPLDQLKPFLKPERVYFDGWGSILTVRGRLSIDMTFLLQINGFFWHNRSLYFAAWLHAQRRKSKKARLQWIQGTVISSGTDSEAFRSLKDGLGIGCPSKSSIIWI